MKVTAIAALIAALLGAGAAYEVQELRLHESQSTMQSKYDKDMKAISDKAESDQRQALLDQQASMKAYGDLDTKYQGEKDANEQTIAGLRADVAAGRRVVSINGASCATSILTAQATATPGSVGAGAVTVSPDLQQHLLDLQQSIQQDALKIQYHIDFWKATP